MVHNAAAVVVVVAVVMFVVVCHCSYLVLLVACGLCNQ